MLILKTSQKKAGGKMERNGKEWKTKEEWFMKEDVGDHIPRLAHPKNISAAATTEEPSFLLREYEGKSYHFVIRMMARILCAVKKKSLLVQYTVLFRIFKMQKSSC